MHSGVLSYVERRQVETEGLDAPPQTLHAPRPGMFTSAREQALVQETQVGEELRRLAVGSGRVSQRRFEAPIDVEEKGAVRHVAPARRQPALDLGLQAAVRRQTRFEGRRDGDTAAR